MPYSKVLLTAMKSTGYLFALGKRVELLTCAEYVRRAIDTWSHEIVDKALLDIWRRPSLHYTRRLAEWELRAWLLGILRRAADMDESLGFVHFSRPILWREVVETVRILLFRTMMAVGGSPDTEADLRRFFNQYLIRLGEHYEPIPSRPPQQNMPSDWRASCL
jgi:hypothetical protein